MNGAEVIPKFHMPPIGNPEVIGFLEKLLADARSGAVTGIGVVMCGAGSLNAVIVGAAPLPSVYTGGGLLMQSAMSQMTGAVKPSRLVVPVR